jgi:hypothetical protein
MLKELTAVISDENTDIRGVDLKRDEEGEAIIEFIVEAEDVRHLNRMVLGCERGRRAPGAADAEGVGAGVSFRDQGSACWSISPISCQKNHSKSQWTSQSSGCAPAAIHLH